ncbi:hypothetical protein P3U08_11600 [Staphylococcus pseudintermedius]|uniref:hypothetical protein n=1 Tax=Staphylococcus pseudintermedius TaxID=283734 RepID=UPI002AFCDE41|nr:hypothetical protein [Staphylococcus pseudintermedius]EIK0300136.1 hypothetical protein [Staphylococcus pseudintermedius]EMC0298934.1 hypothetical protein [Staphylococcus pseudintermedius]WQJ39605.1 hypothetical protein P3U08_11600 [Staphylococcus pseudintermedius]
MTKKVNFYIPIIYCNDEPTRTPVTDLINHIIRLDIEDREVEIQDEFYSIIQYRDPFERNDINDSYFCMGRYRNKKPKQGERGTDRLDNIDYDIIEPISAYHCHVNHLFMFEYNHFGPRKTKIENYFSSFLRNNEDEMWEFKFLSIEKDFDLNELRNAEQIKQIEASFSRENNLNRLENLNDNDNLGPIITMINSINHFLHNDGGNMADIKISNGRLANNHLDQEVMMLFIDLVLQNNLNDNFAKFNVRYKPLNGPTKTVNLSDYGNYISEVEREEDAEGWEYIIDTVERDYRDNHYEILNRKVNQILRDLHFSERIYYL